MTDAKEDLVILKPIEAKVNHLLDKWNKTTNRDEMDTAIKFILTSGSELIELAEQLAELSLLMYTKDEKNRIKKKCVMEGFKKIYSQVNFDIPILPEFIEKKVENWIIEKLASILVDWMVDDKKRTGVLTAWAIKSAE